jgi:hypothetical protein
MERTVRLQSVLRSYKSGHPKGVLHDVSQKDTVMTNTFFIHVKPA